MNLKLLALCAPFLASPALAQSNLIGVYDADGDGVLSRTEFTAAQKDMFARMDADGNGAVTQAEISALAAANGRKADGSRVMSRDANADGAVTEAEFLQNARGFQRADRNRDGVLGPRELQRVSAAIARIQG